MRISSVKLYRGDRHDINYTALILVSQRWYRIVFLIHYAPLLLVVSLNLNLKNLLLILKFSLNQIFSVLFGPHFIKVNINENNKFSLKLCYKKTS